jgi:hypothetical protein
MTADSRKRPDEFLDEVRAIHARPEARVERHVVDQVQAAERDARRYIRNATNDPPSVYVDSGNVDEKQEALFLALCAAAERHGLRSQRDLAHARPECVTLPHRRGYCDVCDTRAHRLIEMLSQFAHLVFRARVCVRCRRFAPSEPNREAA